MPTSRRATPTPRRSTPPTTARCATSCSPSAARCCSSRWPPWPRAGWSPAARCARSAASRPPRARSRSARSTRASRWKGRATSCASWPTPSTRCSAPRGRVREPAALRGQRVARAAHAAGDRAHRARRHPRRSRCRPRRAARDGLVVRDANERMERLIASLLALASTEAGIVQTRPADLAEIVAPALEREEAFGAGGALQLDATLDPRAGARRRGPARAPGREPRSRTRCATTRPSAGWGAHRDRRGEAACDVANAGRASTRRARSRGCWSRSGGWSPRARARPAATASAWPWSGRWPRPTAAASPCSPAREGGLEVTVSLPMACSDAGEPIAAPPGAPPPRNP